MKYQYNDGGRQAAGYKGEAGDCGCRSIAIATQLPYLDVYNRINELSLSERTGKRKRGKSNARSGVYKPLMRKFLAELGWQWNPTMQIGSGCKVHLIDGELPMGRLIVSLSKHSTAIIDGVIHDTFNPQWQKIHEDGHISDRCVYGYWCKAVQVATLYSIQPSSDSFNQITK